MKTGISNARLGVLSLAVAGAFPVAAQTAPDQPVVTLPETVVTATRFPQSASAVPYAVGVITAEQIRAIGAGSVNEAIMKILGVPGRLDTSGGGNYSLDLRGFGGTAERNQVVIVDGRRLKEDELSATNLAVVPIETVVRIDVLRGTGTVQYGEGAAGGVIVVTTRAGKGSVGSNAGQVAVAAGSFGQREATASAQLVSGGFAVDVAAKDSKSNGFRTNQATTSNNLASSVQWSNDWLRLGVLSGRQMVQSGWPGGLTAAQYEANATQASSLVNLGTSKSENSGVFAQATLAGWEWALDANTRTRTVRNFSGSAYGADIAAMNTNVRARHASNWEAIHNDFAVGLDTGQWSNMSTSAVLSDSQTSALYVTDDVTFTPSETRLSVGFRSEMLTKKRSSSTVKSEEKPTGWSLGLSQVLASDVTAYGRLGTSYRLPTADEFTFTVPGTTLQMQTSRDWEFGARWVQRTSKLELRWYRNDLNNELGYDPVIANSNSFNGVGANVNFAPTRRQGLELEASQQLSTALAVRVNLAVREAKFVEGSYAGNDVALVPRQTVALGATWQPAGGHVLDTGLNWVASQSPTFSNQCQMPAYTTVDMRYAYTAGNVEWALGVKNLADTRYYTLAFGCTAGVTTSIYPEAGRSVVASARLKF
jgi:iron complex outermembrane recepter protein